MRCKETFYFTAEQSMKNHSIAKEEVGKLGVKWMGMEWRLNCYRRQNKQNKSLTSSKISLEKYLWLPVLDNFYFSFNFYMCLIVLHLHKYKN